MTPGMSMDKTLFEDLASSLHEAKAISKGKTQASRRVEVGAPDGENGVLKAYEKGRLKSVATKSELTKFKTAARATAIKDRGVNIRLSSGDLSDIQVKAPPSEPLIPNATTIQAMKDARAGKVTKAANLATLSADLNDDT